MATIAILFSKQNLNVMNTVSMLVLVCLSIRMEYFGTDLFRRTILDRFEITTLIKDY